MNLDDLLLFHLMLLMLAVSSWNLSVGFRTLQETGEIGVLILCSLLWLIGMGGSLCIAYEEGRKSKGK